MKNETRPNPGGAFRNETEAADAWAGYLRQLGPAAPRPELAGTARVAFCAGFLAARKVKH